MSIMRCPQCNGSTKVVASRVAPDHAVRRHRVCLECDDTFTTYERVGRVEAAPVAGRMMLTVGEAARRMGLSRTVAYEMANTGRIPAMRYNHRIWVDPDWVELQVAARREAVAMRPDGV